MLTRFVSAGRIKAPWSTANIVAGQVTKVEIERHPAAADIIVILVSADPLAGLYRLLARPAAIRSKAPPLFPPSGPSMLAYTC